MGLNFEAILPSLPYILKGVGVTLQYVVLSLFFGILGGGFLAVAKISHRRYLRFLAGAYTSIFRGTPLLVQLALVYYALPQLIGLHLSPYVAGVLAFSLNSIAYVSEIMRGALESIDKGQWEAAHVLGIPRLQVIKNIIIPQAVPRALPGLVNEMIDLLKESALLNHRCRRPNAPRPTSSQRTLPIFRTLPNRRSNILHTGNDPKYDGKTHRETVCQEARIRVSNLRHRLRTP
jgi:arginine/lysine/histidine transport system permease protein